MQKIRVGKEKAGGGVQRCEIPISNRNNRGAGIISARGGEGRKSRGCLHSAHFDDFFSLSFALRTESEHTPRARIYFKPDLCFIQPLELELHCSALPLRQRRGLRCGADTRTEAVLISYKHPVSENESEKNGRHNIYLCGNALKGTSVFEECGYKAS